MPKPPGLFDTRKRSEILAAGLVSAASGAARRSLLIEAAFRDAARDSGRGCTAALR
jgi:hypothetical protein